MSRFGPCALVAVLAATSSAPARGAEARFVVAPPGAWVEALDVPTVAVAPADQSTGTRYLLADEQIRARSGGQESYFHTAWRLETTAGLQDASEVAIGFDPSFQRLVLHHARVLRDGRIAWSATAGDVRITDAEDDPDARLYHAELTATIFLKALEVGDTVEYAYTLEGTNPVLADHFDEVLWFEYSEPIDRVRRRILWQRPTQLRLQRHGRAPEPTVTQAAGTTLYSWEMTDASAPAREEDAPAWFDPDARVEASDFAGWQEVAHRFGELFAAVDEPAPAIDAFVRSWDLEAAPEDARIDHAVRFVQDDVRYLGLEMGPHSHQPHRPAETLERRFGDCKDKAALLVAILRRLGVKAEPALVSTWAREALDQRLPSLFAFDHVIVAIHSGGERHYVDATASEQGGAVRERRPPPFGRALLVEEAEGGLTTIPEPPLETPIVEVDETYVVPRGSAPARLTVVTTYRGAEADDMRQARARSTAAEIGERYREFYEQEHEGIEVLEPPRIEDDRESNVVVVEEAYEIPALWRAGAHDFHAWLVDERLLRPRSLGRVAPFEIAHPEYARHSLTIKLSGPPGLKPFRESVAGPHFRVDASATVKGNEARLEYVYRSLGRTVEPDGVADFASRVERAERLVVRRVRAPRTRGAPEPPDPWLGLQMLGGATLVLLVWGTRAGWSRWRAHRRRAAFALRTRGPVGEEPGSALVVSSPAEIPRSGDAGVCDCAGPWREATRSALAYDGRPMTVVTRRCDQCAGERTFFFRTP